MMVLALLGGCAEPRVVVSPTADEAALPNVLAAPATDRINGSLGTVRATPRAAVSNAAPSELQVPSSTPATGTGGDIMLNFADTDIRTVVAQILGTLLEANYTIDPGVTGSVTLRTIKPLSRAQLIPTLQTLLGQTGASLIQSNGFYRVVPQSAAAAAGGVAFGPGEAGSTVVPLRFAAAADLAKVLEPFIGNGGKIIPDPGRNALVISGEPGARDALVALIHAFDINELAGQSYALLPVESGDAKDFAAALQDAINGKAGLANAVRVVPMQRLNAVLVVAAQQRSIAEVQRVYALVEGARRQTVRVWHVYYLQNSRSNDIANVLQQAFTPGHVTAQPTSTTQQSGSSAASQQSNTSSGSGLANSGSGLGQPSAGVVTSQPVAAAATAAATPAPAASTSSNPLLGGLETSDTGSDADTMRIIPDPQTNAILIYGTGQEQDTVLATLRKLDILPLEVRIDAVIAEVDLNDTLQYGTQFFFRGNGLAGALGGTTTGTAASAISSAVSGFVFGSADGQSALSALQAVTTVKVLSSPQLLVQDNHDAHLQVGNIVPYLTQSSQSTLVSGSPVINSINYRNTGVIMDVTPRVNSGGLVTLDISQEVSGIDNTVTPTTGINSPTFTERAVHSRVVIQDGQTVGLAGLISDNDSAGNSGIPWLKDVPVIGLLAGKQNNTRTRTELLVLITPHVIHDQRDARALTEDLRQSLFNAALVPTQLNNRPASGSNDPGKRLRKKLNLEP
jgi:general secretion pathway protein D